MIISLAFMFLFAYLLGVVCGFHLYSPKLMRVAVRAALEKSAPPYKYVTVKYAEPNEFRFDTVLQTFPLTPGQQTNENLTLINETNGANDLIGIMLQNPGAILLVELVR